MRVTAGWDSAQAFDGSMERLPAGGYICRICKAWCETTLRGSEQLVLVLEITEGKYSGFMAKQFNARKSNDANAKWPCLFRQFTLGSDGMTNPFFKGLIKSIEESNGGYRWNWDENTLQNKAIGMIFREEEFVATDGSIKTTIRPAFPRSVQRIREGVEVPEIKRLNNVSGASPAQGGFTEVNDGDLPF